MKTVIATIATGLILTLAPAAYAAPVEISGQATIKYEADSADKLPTESGMMYTITLRGEKKIGKDLSIYARLGAQYASNPLVANYDLSVYGFDNKAVAGIDQFGLLYKTDQLELNLGRQEVTVGVTELLYKRDAENIGNNAFVDGLSFKTKIGAVSVAGIAATEGNIWLPNNSFYAVRGGYSLSKNTNLGFTLAQYQYYNASNSQHWDMDGSIFWGKHSIIGEYAQSNCSTANKAYAITWNYKFNEKTALYLTNFRVESNGDMGKQSEYDNDNRGFYYGMTHEFDNTLSMEVVYKDQVKLAENSKNSKIEVKLKKSF